MSILLIAGGIIGLVGYVWLVIAGFTESVLWGVVCLCVPFGALVFGIMRFAELKAPTIMLIVGLVCRLASYGM